ncbi:insulinase family protein [Planctomicrobium sp. SH668]|uniref:insulinase family protein n=1 Tax=Planctomicrobium sp. SH668 TaxID=3448126 RepID=UPI003F5BBD23
MLRRIAYLCFAGMLMMTAVTKGAEPQPVTQVEGISEYRLENGCRVLLFPDPSKPQVTVNMTVFVGSRHEGYGEAGMAHLLEHMVFKGTPKHPEVPKALKDHGAEFNGTTWLDRTNYYETLPASDENLEFAIALEADRLVNSFIKQEDLTSEMTVVRNEFERGENSPSGILGQRIMSAAFSWHNYGKSTIGNRADIEKVPASRLKVFYENYYQPDNIMVIIAGDFKEELALSLIQKYFGAIPKPERVLEKDYTEEPAQDGERLVTLRRVGDVGFAGTLYHIPPAAHPEFVSIDVAEHILTSSPSGRLYKALVETKLATSVSGGAFALHDPGVIRFMAECTSGVDPKDVLAKLVEITETLGEQGVTDEEVERAKRSLLKNWEMDLTDSARLAVQLSEWAAQGDWRLIFLYRDRLEAVTPASVNEVAKRYLTQNNRTAGVYLPSKEAERVSIPPRMDLAEMIGDYEGRGSVAQGESFDVSPENIEARTTRVVLPSGVKAALLPKKNRGESVVLQLTLRYGDAESLKGFKHAAEVLPSLMLRGTKSLNRQQIQDALDENKAQLFADGNAGEATFQLETRREHLNGALDILRQILREATLPADELEIIRNRRISSNEQAQTDPMQLARVAVSKALSGDYAPNDVRYVATAAEQVKTLKELKVEQVAELYSKFLNGTVGEVAVVGDFDIAEVQPQLEKMLADWTSQKPFAHIPRTANVKLESLHQVIETPDKENATYLAGSVFPMNDENPDYPGVLIANYVLGSSGLSSRLGDRVRQAEGLSYGVGSFVQPSSIDERTTFLTYAISNPTNIPRVEIAIKEEIQKLLDSGITQAELASATTAYLESQKVSRSDDKQIAALLVVTSYLNRKMDFYSKQEASIAGLTVDQVNANFKKWIHPDRIAVVVAGDFKKHAKGETQESVEKEGTEMPADENKQEGFTETASGLKYKIIKEGEGKQPTAANSVTCHYRGWLDNGKEFDSSKGGDPITFPLRGVIAGWTEGLQLIKEGGKIQLEIPSKLGYGDRGYPPVIPAKATLHFEVELIKVN